MFGQETSARPEFAPGGLIVIAPDIGYKSIADRIDYTEVLATVPKAEPALQGDVRFEPEVWAKDIRYNRDVWCLQFSFKPLRIIDVEIPNAAGNFDKKKVWYLVYRVKNLGPAEMNGEKVSEINSSLGSEVPAKKKRNLPVPSDETSLGVPRSPALELRHQAGVSDPRPGNDEPRQFVPHFVLATRRLVLGTVPVTNPDTGATEWQTESTPVAYDDRVIPLALPKIARREGMSSLPETTVSMPLKKIASGEELWGVAMWMDVDPRINEFSIFVSGLTNAYQWSDRVAEDGTYINTGKIGEGRILKRKVLKLDWWRVGDQNSLNETQIHFGSKDLKIPESVFEQQKRKVTPEERKILDSISKDGWISPAESAIHHLIQQDWLLPRLEYEWVFL